MIWVTGVAVFIVLYGIGRHIDDMQDRIDDLESERKDEWEPPDY